jgi:hypothetical protein
VSWFEAAAYCEFGGKTLPTVHHWRKVAGFSIYSDILRFSNLGGVGPARVGAYTGIAGLGAYDMTGNVKEWCWNSAGERRTILGGGWNEPSYMYMMDADAQDPFTRAPSYGFRCALYTGQVPAEAFAPISRPVRDYLTGKPVRDDVFEVFRRMYGRRDAARCENQGVDESDEYFRKEKRHRAAYGDERIPAFLYLPGTRGRHTRLSYGLRADTPMCCARARPACRRSTSVSAPHGRAFYTGLQRYFERRIEGGGGPNAYRDITVQFVKDAFRSVDFLESARKSRTSLGYYGLSTGAVAGPLILALEPRLKTGILVGGGLWGDKIPPEVDWFNFAPRVRAPTLMLNGRYDYGYPPATSQEPLFRLLGTPARDKRHVQFDSGHVPPLQDIMREVLDWLDRYLGPVEANH